MDRYTFGQMLHRIELGQIAEAADGVRRMRLLPEGLFWLNGPFAGDLVRVQNYLLSDLWTIREDEGNDDPQLGKQAREEWQRKRVEMLENQLFEQRARRFDSRDTRE
ncbi:hypothetical protein [Saccharibacillus alkalitolerans]|uniref:Uncharacterized protein n=1 Tax=Saccharibacillus alkalitolerans TaxID=2705290 RepID=A0ABX0F1P8_9BACL|nr:hypothetical protein [Saccharibacillus alkalitolerans]NGZ74902.1 hypothetical protein [Saccharibacillus alkalitolerans]